MKERDSKNSTRRLVLVLGASAFQLPLAESLYETGNAVHVASPRGDYPMISDARFVWHDIDVTDVEGVVALAQKFGIDLILSDQTDLPVSVIWQANHKLGLKGRQEGEVGAFCDKGQCRQVCVKAGLPSPMFQVLNEADALSDGWELKRVVVKPADSQGSRGVQFVKPGDNTLHDAVKIAMGFSKTGRVIVEEFIEGVEIPVEGVICGGKYQTLAIGTRRDFECAPGIPSKCDYVRFDLNIVQHAKLHATLDAFVRTTGVERGMTHAEVIASPDGLCYIVEVALRSGASFIGSHIVPYLSGIDVHQTLMHFGQGRDELAFVPHSKTTDTRKVASFSYFYVESGELNQGIKEWPPVPDFVERYFLPKKPVHFGRPTVKNQRYGPFILFDRLDSVQGRLLREQFAFADERRAIIWD